MSSIRNPSAGPVPAEDEHLRERATRRAARMRTLLDDGARPLWDVHVEEGGIVAVARAQTPGAVWLVESDRVADVVARFVAAPQPELRRLIVTMTQSELAEIAAEPLLFDVLVEPLVTSRTTIALRNAFDSIDAVLANRATTKALTDVETEEAALMEIASALASERHIDRLLSQMLLRFRQLTGADAGSIWTVERAEDLGPAGLAAGGDPDARVLSLRTCQNDSSPVTRSIVAVPITTDSIVGYAASSSQPVHLEDCYAIADDAPYTFSATMDRQSGYRTRSMLSIPMQSRQGELIGVIQLINRKSDGDVVLRTPQDFATAVTAFDPHHIRLASTLAANAAISLENANLYEQIQHLFDKFVDASVFAIESRDPTTSGHSHRVAAYSAELMRAADISRDGPTGDLRFSIDDHRVLRYAALLHDFGKVAVREDVLLKGKKLRPLELELVERRFQFALQAIDKRGLARKLDAVQALGLDRAAGFFGAWDLEVAERKAELLGHLDLIRVAAEPHVMHRDVGRLVDVVASLRFIDHDGVERPLLTAEELTALSVTRGSLTRAERAEIQSHVVHTERFLRQLPWTGPLVEVPEIAARHHEKLDGSGYPHGLSAPALPPAARMLSITDIFDALTAHDRPYKSAVPVPKALDILRAEADAGKLDSDLVTLFVESRAWDTARRLFPEHVR